MLFLQGAAYTHPNRDILFSDINLTINRQHKVALIGNNGSGKSTLLKILAGHLQLSSGIRRVEFTPFYLPQLVGQFDDLTIADALQIEDKWSALSAILEGHVTEENLALVGDDWGLEERCNAAFAHWGLDGLDLSKKMGTLSGGQKTKVFLAGITIHDPEIVLLDEPSNHLDRSSRDSLYQFIKNTPATLMVVSHDKVLLNLLDQVFELSRKGIAVYGGNYDFYREQKQIEDESLHQELKRAEKALRKARETEREAAERQSKLDARGKRKQEKAGLPTILMNTLKNNAERSTANMKRVHEEKVGGIAQNLSHLRQEMPEKGKMKMDLNASTLAQRKVLASAKDVNFGYADSFLWKQGLSFQLFSGERVVIEGDNGSGKSTLINLILGRIAPLSGAIDRTAIRAVYVDQDYALIDDRLSVYDQAQQYNDGALAEHEIKIRLNRFLFSKAHWDKPCSELSGGEKMRLVLCCLMIGNQAPDLMVLDEPTNNLDIQSSEILAEAIREYKGTLLVVSHDQYFLEQLSIERSIVLGDFAF